MFRLKEIHVLTFFAYCLHGGFISYFEWQTAVLKAGYPSHRFLLEPLILPSEKPKGTD